MISEVNKGREDGVLGRVKQTLIAMPKLSRMAEKTEMCNPSHPVAVFPCRRIIRAIG